MLQAIIILNLIHSSLNYSIIGMSQEQQYQAFSLQILPNSFEQDSYQTIIIRILTYYETEILPKVAFLGISFSFYQKLATIYQPYNISSINKIDVGSVQICSFAIFLTATAYSYQQDNLQLALIIQIIIILLFIRLCFSFLNDTFRVYYKKHKITFSTIVTLLKKSKQLQVLLIYQLENQVFGKKNRFFLKTMQKSFGIIQYQYRKFGLNNKEFLLLNFLHQHQQEKQNSREYETKKLLDLICENQLLVKYLQNYFNNFTSLQNKINLNNDDVMHNWVSSRTISEEFKKIDLVYQLNENIRKSTNFIQFGLKH